MGALKPFELWIEGRPKTKERPRLRRGNMRAYTPRATRDAEERIRAAYVAANGPDFGDQQVYVTLEFTKMGTKLTIIPAAQEHPKQPTGDLDNYAKTVLDALQDVAYRNDRQVVLLALVKGSFPEGQGWVGNKLTNVPNDGTMAA